MYQSTPLGELIENRIRDICLSREELGRRLGYTNPAKASGRVDSLCSGHITSRKSVSALKRLATALDANDSVVSEAVNATRALQENDRFRREQNERLAQQAKEQVWRAAFRPHAVLLTERRVPTQITICGLVGGPRRFLVIPLDASKPPVTFVQQTLAALPSLVDSGTRRVPFFGAVQGFVVNYTPGSAVRFDLDGNAMEVLSAPYYVGKIAVSVRRPRVRTH